MNRVFFRSICIVAAVLFYFTAGAQKNYETPDYRRKTESFVRLQPKAVRMDVATFALGGISESVGLEPIRKIPYTSFSSDSMLFEGEGIRALIKLAPFDKTGRRLDYDEKFLTRIDRRPYYGNYGKVPQTIISDVVLTIYGDTIAIPKTAYSDLFNTNLTYIDKGVQRTTNAIYQSKDGKYLYLYLFSRDKTGSYEVTWIFQDRKYLRRVLDYDIM